MARAAGLERHPKRVPQALPRYTLPEQVEFQPAQENGGPPRQAGIQVIQRVGAILDALRATEISLSLGQLAGETGLARSTVQRIVQALQDVGWMTLPVPDGGVFLGSRLIRLAAAAVGETFPLHCIANGKAMLATLPGPLVETIIGRSFPALARATLLRQRAADSRGTPRRRSRC